MNKDFPSPNLESEERASFGSSSSSFLPIENNFNEDALQLINEKKEFNQSILDYVEKSTNKSIDHNYHVISVFGSQSTGKSTLLNQLFRTNFDVMNESSRQQTTKGIWLAHSPGINCTSKGNSSSSDSVFVMDVEGTDGRERGEDQDFERKAALFALATSDILIINIWEHQIGLYQGANMGLLKTVFEVNLSLFGRSKLEKNDHKVLLLFAIRDHIGNTPKENLVRTITEDIKNMWNSLNKPVDLSELLFEDFFDLDFHTLSHKVLQPNEFTEDVKSLGDRFMCENSLFKPIYHHNIPVDGWTMYAESCWNQIDSNKDLDLPTQQILVAKFKCDEILNQVFDEFLLKYQELSSRISDTKYLSELDFKEFGLYLVDLKHDALENFDISASRYNKSIHSQKHSLLNEKLNEKLKDIIDVVAKYSIMASQQTFERCLKEIKGKNFVAEVEKLKFNTSAAFEANLSLLSLKGDLSYDSHFEELQKTLDTLITKQQSIELNSIINKALKKVSINTSKAVQQELVNPTENSWDKINKKFEESLSEVSSKYLSGDVHDFGLGTSSDVNEDMMEKLNFNSWVRFHDVTRKLITKDSLLTILKDKFDDKFRYDENGLPKLYQNATELDSSFATAKSFALAILPLLSIAKLSDCSEILPEYNIFDKSLRQKYGLDSKAADFIDDDNDSDEEETYCFSEIISEEDKAEILTKFRKEVDAKYIETKRSIIQHVTQIPYYIYLVILVLGWNEFMAIIRNPFFFSLLILLAASLYVMYTLNLLKPASMVAQRLIDEALTVGKEKLRELLLAEDHQTHAKNLSKIAGSDPASDTETSSQRIQS